MMKIQTNLPQHTITEVTSRLIENQGEINLKPPRILLLYGSLRKRSYSRLLSYTASEILQSFGAEVEIFHPHELPLANIGLTHSKDDKILPESVQQLRALTNWCEAMVWVSPEVHGNVSAVLKNQIDWIPLSTGAVRPTQGKVLALMQVSGGSQSFNAVNNLRILGRWMRMFTIPNQSSVAKAYEQFNEDGSMKESSYLDRVIDVMEELFKFTLLLREHKPYLVERFSENKQKLVTEEAA